MTTLHKLSPKKLLLLARTSSLLLSLKLSLKLLPIKTTQRWLNRFSVSVSPKGDYQTVKADIVWAIDMLSPYLGATCLPRALAAKLLLAQAGYSSTLRIGMAKSAGNLEGHAWLERDGDIIIGKLADLARFILMPALEDSWRIVN